MVKIEFREPAGVYGVGKTSAREVKGVAFIDDDLIGFELVLIPYGDTGVRIKLESEAVASFKYLYDFFNSIFKPYSKDHEGPTKFHSEISAEWIIDGLNDVLKIINELSEKMNEEWGEKVEEGLVSIGYMPLIFKKAGVNESMSDEEIAEMLSKVTFYQYTKEFIEYYRKKGMFPKAKKT